MILRWQPGDPVWVDWDGRREPGVVSEVITTGPPVLFHVIATDSYGKSWSVRGSHLTPRETK